MNYSIYQKPFPILEFNEAYYLREQSLEDTAAFFEYYSDPIVSEHILASIPKDLTSAMNEIHYCRSLFYNKSGFYWSIAQKSNQCMIGAVGLHINNPHNRGEICYDLHKAYWRCGIMSNAIGRILQFAFECIQLDRIEAITTKTNTASIALLKKLGFLHEGTLSNYRQYKNQPHDVELFGITPNLYLP